MNDFSTLCREYPIHVVIRRDDVVVQDVQVQEIGEARTILDGVRAEVRRDEGEWAASNVASEITFPPQRITIGRWAKEWANNRTLHIDPESPYFAIFQEAFRLKDQIAGGELANGDYRNYSVNEEPDLHYYWGASFFQQILWSLMGFQELSREENRTLMRELDNCTPEFRGNPRDQFATALSKVLYFSTDPGRPMGPNRLDAPMTAFLAAQARGKILQYFQEAFEINTTLSFDYQVSQFRRFLLDLMGDFTPNLADKFRIREIIAEYYRVFMYTQMFKMARQEGGEDVEGMYTRLKEGQGDRNCLFERYITKDNFERFLDEHGNPIRALPAVLPNMVPPPEIPFDMTNWSWIGNMPEKTTVILPLGTIPPESRYVGAVLGVKDRNLYLAIVKIRGGLGQPTQYSLSFTKSVAAPYQEEGQEQELPVLENFRQSWGRKKEEIIEENQLPEGRRHDGALVLIRDPDLYQLRVDSLGRNVATLKFYGDPIPRARWEEYLPDDMYWTA